MKNELPKIEALLNQIWSGNLKNNTAKVLAHIIKENGSYVEKMRNELNMPHQTLTSRISQLEDMGVIYVANIVRGEKRNFSFYQYEPLGFMRDIRKEKKRELKFDLLKKRLVRDFSDLMTEDLHELMNS